MASVVVVEDEPLARRVLTVGLHKAEFEVHEAGGAADCREIVRSRAIDVAIVDLDEADRLDLAAELIRQRDIGVIVVTPSSAHQARIDALDAGASDYVVEPVHLGELAARVRSLVRRRAQSRARTWRLGHWRVDFDARTVHAGGDGVRLTRGEFDILEALIGAAGAVASRQDLLGRISRRPHDADPRSVDVLISRLRRKLRAHIDTCAILTVGGRGYQLAEPAQPA